MLLSNIQLDSLKEVVNIGVGKASSVLSEMLDSRVHLSVPSLKILKAADLKDYQQFNNTNLSMVNMGFEGCFNGSIMLAFPPKSADIMVTNLTGEELSGSEMDSIRSGALIEVGNILLNGVLGSLSNIIDERLDYTIPMYYEDNIQNMMKQKTTNITQDKILILLAETKFEIDTLEISGKVLLFMELDSFNTLLQKLNTLVNESPN